MQAFDIAIDVSDNNEVSDWPMVFAAGIRIAFVKAMEGAGMHYPTWGPQSEGARRAGLIVIPYLFLRPGDPKQIVNAFIRVTGLGPGMAFALDWEGRANQTASPQIAERVGEELAIVAGRPPIGYWGIPGSTPAAPTAKMLLWPRWVPRYPMQGARDWQAIPAAILADPAARWRTGTANLPLPYFGQYTAWGRVPGIQGDVDRSVAFFPTIDDALVWCGRAPGKPVDARNAAAPASTSKREPPHSAAAAPAAAAKETEIDTDHEADRLNAEELARLATQGETR